MARNLVDDIVQNRERFLKHLEEELRENDEIIENATATLDKLKITSDNVAFLGQKVEHTALIPLGANIYVNGFINHTGEYFVDKLAFPNSYSVVETLNNTQELLRNKIKKQSELVEKSEITKAQIEERIKLLEIKDSGDDASPKEIISDRGIAMKVGEFYEIVEFEN